MTLASWSASVDRVIDLNDIARDHGVLFVRDGVGVAGIGNVATATSADIDDVLRSVTIGGSGIAPVAIGTLPFDPSQPGYLRIPEVCVRKFADGTTQAIAVAETPSDARARLEAFLRDISREVPRPRPTASSFRIEPLTPIDVYLSAVTAARDAVREGRITKAVIARSIRVTSDSPIDLHGVLLRLRASFGSSYRYSIDGLVGASPELLVEVEGDTVRSNPLAGTTTRTGDPDTDRRLAEALLASEKNQIEHRVVVDMVHDTLLPHCSYLDWEPEASVVPVANVQHLGTRVEGRLSRRVPSAQLARLLAPTPALGGHPRDAAVDLIQSVEGMERGNYGGGVGWCDASGDGTFAVTIRCAEFADDRRSATLFAGGGIVADSEPESELAETQAKFQAMLSAIVRP